MRVDNIDDMLERAFWRFDALHKAYYRDVEPSLPGPMSERDACKRAVRETVLDAVGLLDTDVAALQAGAAKEGKEQ